MRGLKKASDEQNDEKMLCVTFEIVQILAKFQRAGHVKPDNSPINIPDLNRVAV